MKTKLVILALLIAAISQAQSLEGLKKVNGTSLYFHTMGSGDPLLIVHGGPGLNQSYFMPHFNSLSKKYTLIFYDQRASGKSFTPSSDSVSLKFFAEDIEAIRKELGVEKLNLLGHSWGAIPVINYGILFPDHVKKMILSNPVPLSPEYDAQILDNQKKVFDARDSTDRSLIIGSRGFKNGDSDSYRNLLLITFRHSFYDPRNASKLQLELPANFKASSQVLAAGLAKDLSYNYFETIKSFTFPVLIQHGASDLVPLAAATMAQSKMQHASLEVFKKSGHFIFIEETAKFSAGVKSFLANP